VSWGPQALINDEKWGALKKRVEHHQLESVVGAHPGGTLEVQNLIMARRLGIQPNLGAGCRPSGSNTGTLAGRHLFMLEND